MGKISLLFLLSIFFCCSVQAKTTHILESYFKRADNKTDNYVNPLRNINFIYVINLDQRPEKLAYCQAELNPYGITPYRFSAVNGWELTLEDLNKLGVKYEPGMKKDLWGTSYLTEDFQPHHEVMSVEGRNYFCHCFARGTIGITLSHLSVLQDAYDSGYETIWVMEDDIQVIRDPRILSDLIAELDNLVGKEKWDILFTDRDSKDRNGKLVVCNSYAKRPNFDPKNPERFAMRSKVGKDFRKLGARYGAYSMIIRRAGMKKILDFIKKYSIFLPYDMEFYLPHKLNMYTVLDDVVSTLPTALSDNGGANYKNKVTTINQIEDKTVVVPAASSPIEYNIPSDVIKLKQNVQTKQIALQAMNQLEGWCSKFKASEMIDLIFKTDAQIIVEIGVFGGKSLLPMALALKEKDAGIIYGIDPWSSASSAEGMTGQNRDWWSAVDHEAIYQGLCNKIGEFNLEKWIELRRCTSDEAAPIANIDILHIDGNHSEKNSLNDVCKWVPLVKEKGFIIFNDTAWDSTSHAVEWLNEHCIKIVEYRAEDNWGIWFKP